MTNGYIRRTSGSFRALVLAGCLAAGPAGGEAYPSKPIRMLAPEPGGGNEIAGRMIARALSEALGQPLVVENRGAASGVIAGEIVAKANPDGYTLLYYGSTIWLLPFLREKVPFDPLRDFAPISLATTAPFFLFAHPSVPAKNAAELIALAKARPGELMYGSAGSGAATHLSAELFNRAAGVKIMRVAYKGAGLAANALAAGEVQIMFGSVSLGLGFAKAGRLKILGVASSKPSPQAPEVPTIAASGLPGFEAASMSGMFAPARTPPALIRRLNREILKVLERSDVRERLLAAGIEPIGSSPEEFAATLRADQAKWGKLIRELNIRE
jgi:tripartite-type tricarboxylate transporter receptor subunit TctC